MQTTAGPADEARLQRFRELTETARGTPMGTMLRQFWHPIGLSRSVEPGKARAVRILSEDLALYRGHSGKAYLVTNRCAHRLTKLHTGWIEGDDIRCMYHGWKFDGTGQCVERPAERPGTEKTVRIRAYPVHEYLGIVFAYFGDGPAPEFDLPRKPKLEGDDVLIFTRTEVWPCNWLQHAENSLDAVHVSFAHMMGKVGAFGDAITTEIPSLDYVETTAGIQQTATRNIGGKQQIRVSNWTFPYGNHVSVPGRKANEPWTDSCNWMVPIDDTHTLRVSLRGSPSTTPEQDAEFKSYFAEMENYSSAALHDELFAGKYPEDDLIGLTSAQDYVVLVGQGAIVDRASEMLGQSDRGVATLRRILWRELDAIRAGQTPKQWTRLEQTPTLFTYAEAQPAPAEAN